MAHPSLMPYSQGEGDYAQGPSTLLMGLLLKDTISVLRSFTCTLRLSRDCAACQRAQRQISHLPSTQRHTLQCMCAQVLLGLSVMDLSSAGKEQSAVHALVHSLCMHDC